MKGETSVNRKKKKSFDVERRYAKAGLHCGEKTHLKRNGKTD